MVLAREVSLGSAGRSLPAGTILSEEHIDRLREQGTRAVLIEEPAVDDVEVRELVSADLKMRILDALRKAYDSVRKSSGSRGLLIHSAEYEALGDKLVREVHRNREKEYCLAVSPSLADYEYYHALNTAAVSLLIGMHRRYKPFLLQHLAVAALLHDVGNALLPPEIYESPGELEGNELEQVRQHPALGFQILKRSAFDTWVYAIVGQHHERWNGQGYPKGLVRDQVLEPARIVGIAEVYDALMADRPHRASLPPHLAVEYLLAESGNLFDHGLVQALAESVPTYYVGSTVKLNTGEIGVVTGANVGLVARPVVRVCWDSSGVAIAKPFEADMSVPPFLDYMITEAMDH